LRAISESGDSLARRLHDFIAAQLPPDAGVALENLRRTTGGYSRENWLFEASWSEGGRRVARNLIMRRDPVGSVLETDRRVEFEVLRALEGCAVPSPRALFVDADGSRLERPSVVMERLDGLNDHFVLEGGLSQLPLDRRVALARCYCENLAALHRFDWRAAGLGGVLGDPGTRGAAAAVAEWRAVYERQLLEPNPELECVLQWLEENAPEAQATVLVHGDWKPGNSLLSRGELQVMLDWETVHLGDPLEDVGWVTNPLRQREHLIPGAWERDDLVRHYESVSGFRADPESLHYWNVFANFKLNTILLTGVRSFCEGRSERPWSDEGSLARMMFQMLGWAR
jgi:aminoglycoside phosphotransferase (APT) family kinase protein